MGGQFRLRAKFSFLLVGILLFITLATAGHLHDIQALWHIRQATIPVTGMAAAPVGTTTGAVVNVVADASLAPDHRGQAPGSSLSDRMSGASAALLAPDILRYEVQRGDSLPALVHRYLPETSYMTGKELETAIRAANPELPRSLKPGSQLVIPGYLSAPILERPVLVAKDFEARAIYLTGLMAGSYNGLDIIRRWRQAGGNTVVFDVKDSDGSVSVPFRHPLAPTTTPYIRNLPKFVRFVHAQNMHVIARIAIFRDEALAVHHPELTIHSRRSGRAGWRENGKLVWMDPSNREVQDYNIALAKFAAESGIDEVQFDYVRFPAEGDQKDAAFDYQASHPSWQRSDVIVDFLQRAHNEIHAQGVLFSLDVFGVMAWQREVDLAHTGQDIPRMARHCEVLSPMIYPSHFFGMDGYAAPGDAPEHFISASMERFAKITEDTGVVLRPWLQAFGWRTKTYSPDYIRVQVKTAKQHNGIGFLFWNARNDYSKPFEAMPSMRSTPGTYFRGDEIPIAPVPPAKATPAMTAGL